MVTSTELMKNGSDCGNYIRQSSTGILSESELQQKKKIFDMILQQTFNFVGELKGLAIDVLKEVEAHGDDYNEKLIADKLETILKTMATHSALLKHIATSLPKLEKSIHYVGGDMDSGGCVFARQLQKSGAKTSAPKLEKPMEHSDELGSETCTFAHDTSPKKGDAAALCQFGFMAEPKAKPKPRQKSFFMPDPVGSACVIL
jgi:hypothetical protein